MFKNKAWSSFTRHGNKLLANGDPGEVFNKLTPGMYTPHYDQQRNMFWFQEANAMSDEILELPSPEYSQITKELKLFLEPTTKLLFEKFGYLYKRSALLHGEPGTGKTIIVQRVMRDVVALGGIVIYVDDPRLLEIAYKVLDDITPGLLTMVVFEEFDRMAGRYEATLLSLLDGEIQKENVIYMATTNYIDKIPMRLRLPGRFSSVIEIKYPTSAARKYYFNYKLEDVALAKDLAAQSKGLSVDEMKEVIQAHIILKQDLGVVLNRLKTSRDFVEISEIQDDTEYEAHEDFEEAKEEA